MTDKVKVTNQKFVKLKELLMELFQLDQPELDFGFYRVMHARAKEVTQFLEKDLLPQVAEVFEQYQSADAAGLQEELEQAISQAKALGADPDTLPKVKELKGKLSTTAVDISRLESEVYDHLYTFFRRYYHEGDFLSKRVYKDGVYAIPYSGEEVKLHWANADQYYIKTDEYLKDYSFRLNPSDDKNPMRVHFRISAAREGEHGNVKTADNAERRFILADDSFITEEDGDQGKELVLLFEYRPSQMSDWAVDSKEGKKAPPVQKDLLQNAVKKVLEVTDPTFSKWSKLLMSAAPSPQNSSRTNLEKHLDRYTKRNTFDYFIHKNLGGFLRQELDFYIKNEVMHLDDIQNENVPKVEQYLSKIKAIRKIAGKLIEFLAQLEDFQKRLWLKKKFVVETNYCITLDRIKDSFLEEIAANDAQRKEWVKLFAIENIKGDLVTPGYSEPLTPEFLRTNRNLVLDTCFFDSKFKELLINSIQEVDAECGGTIVQSENFQMLRLLRNRFSEEIKCIHIDPPYNTASSGFLYKNQYEHSSWLSLMQDRVALAVDYLNKEGVFCCHIDEYEMEKLHILLDQMQLTNAGTLVWDKGMPIAGANGLATQHEYVLFRTKGNVSIRVKKKNIDLIHTKIRELLSAHGSASKSAISEYRKWLKGQAEFSKGEMTYDQFDQTGKAFRSDNMSATDRRTNEKFYIPLKHPIDGQPCPVPEYGWRYTPESIETLIANGLVLFGEDHTTMPRKKSYLEDTTDSQMPTIFRSGGRGKSMLDSMKLEFPFAHAVDFYSYLIDASVGKGDTVLDFFAGSGTTGHAVLQMNHADGGSRKYLLGEMGTHFDTVLKVRIVKALYSRSWAEGIPVSRTDGISHFFKYIRLESYEDALNNLESSRSQSTQLTLENLHTQNAGSFKEHYMLRYMLSVEMRTSQSLLNIQDFIDPTSYRMKVKRPGTDESREMNIDLLETFNYLLGLRVSHIATAGTFSATFKRDDEGKLVLTGQVKQITDGKDSPWWFRTVSGKDPEGRRVLVIWRKRPGGDTADGIEQDNLVLNEWFRKLGFSTKDSEFDVIYVNGSSNLENVRTADERWKVRLIEEDFMRLMFDVEEV